MTTAKLIDAFANPTEIETFVKVRVTLDFAEKRPRGAKMQLLVRAIGDAWVGDLSNPAAAAMQHVHTLKDLPTSSGGCERITDRTTVSLEHVHELRIVLERTKSGDSDERPQIAALTKGIF